MKRINLVAGGIILSVVLFACNQTPKPTTEEKKAVSTTEQTIENLKAAITGESNASAKYTAFSKAAETAKMPNIAKLFAAAAQAELIHVSNHRAVLKNLGVEGFEPVIEEHVADKDMVKNLENAIAGETAEFTTMYPSFIETANGEKVPDAAKSFEFAMKAEKRHAEHYQAALDILKADKNDKKVSKEWYLCPICGELTPTIVGMSFCSICGEKTEEFKKF